MKIKQEFVLREVANENILIPIVSTSDVFQGILTLNETGVFIWKLIESGDNVETIANKLFEEYEVSADQAVKNVKRFCENLKELGILDEVI